MPLRHPSEADSPVTYHPLHHSCCVSLFHCASHAPTTRCLAIDFSRKQSPRDSRTTNRGWRRGRSASSKTLSTASARVVWRDRQDHFLRIGQVHDQQMHRSKQPFKHRSSLRCACSVRYGLSLRIGRSYPILSNWPHLSWLGRAFSTWSLPTGSLRCQTAIES